MAHSQLKNIISNLLSLENLQQDRLLFYNLTQDMTIPADLLLCLESIAILNPTTRDLIEAAKDTSLDYIKESHSFAVNLIVPRRRLVILDERYLEVESLIQARYIKTNSEEVDEDVYEFESENEVVEQSMLLLSKGYQVAILPEYPYFHLLGIHATQVPDAQLHDIFNIDSLQAKGKTYEREEILSFMEKAKPPKIPLRMRMLAQYIHAIRKIPNVTLECRKTDLFTSVNPIRSLIVS